MAKARKPRAADVVLAYLGEQRDVISQLEPDVRVDAPDAVHQTRVATRRARSTLQAHRNVLDREFTRALADELKWLAGVLGEARDLEVLGEGIAADVAAQPAELVLGPVQARVATYFVARMPTRIAAWPKHWTRSATATCSPRSTCCSPTRRC